MEKDFYFETYQIGVERCKFCGISPKFFVDEIYTSGDFFGANIKFGCYMCNTYLGSAGRLYKIEFMIDPNHMPGIRCTKDERLDLILLWNKRACAGDVGGDI